MITALMAILVLMGTAAAATAQEAKGAQTHEAMSFAQAQQQAEMEGKLLLVDFYAEWCGPCKRFQADAESSDALREGLDKVVFISVDCEKGEGVELAKRYGVRSFPNYLLADATGEPIYRWVGYGTPESFVEQLEKGLSDPTTLKQKRERFAENPTAADAETLANAAAAASDQVKAAEWYQKASELAGGGYEMEIFYSKFYGFRQGAFTVDDLVAAADEVMAKGSDEEKAQVYAAQSYLAQATGVDSLAYRYLDEFWEMLKDNDDPKMQKMRRRVEIDHALYVEKDPQKAAQLKYDSMPAGWLENADGLNEYAWWCFENKIDLERAEKLARRGVEIATDGSQKAAVLDTAAEICNLRGHPEEAVELARQAIESDPGNAYYQKQLERFQALVKKSG